MSIEFSAYGDLIMILGSSIMDLFKWDYRSRSTAMQFHQSCEAFSVSAWIVLEVIRDGSLQKLRLPYIPHMLQ